MKHFPKVLIGVLTINVIVVGCSVIGQPAAEKLAPLVNEYCEREPFSARQLYRETINAELDGHKIAVHCAGDPE